MSAQVWGRVVAGSYKSAPGKVRGFARRRIRGVSYPALIREASGEVEGILYCEVGEEDIARLDHFEGEAYARIQVMVEVAGTTVEAYTYLFLERERVNLSEWTMDSFDAAAFLRDYRPGVG